MYAALDPIYMTEHRFTVDLLDAAGEVLASCEKLLSIRQRLTHQPA